MNEAELQTRKQRIDTRLRGLNPPWQLIPYRAGLDVARLNRHAVTEFPTANGPADYGLFVNGRFLGIIEAKKLTVNPQNVLEQAKRYSRGAFNGPGDWNGYRVPFLYATNGELVWFLDVRAQKAVSRQLSGFHTAPALDALFAFDLKPAHDWLLDTPPDIIALLRDYQRRCILATGGAIIAGRRGWIGRHSPPRRCGSSMPSLPRASASSRRSTSSILSGSSARTSAPTPRLTPLRRQRPPAHVARRSAREDLPRVVRPGRRVRAEDHR